jgi:hypothetical protein
MEEQTEIKVIKIKKQQLVGLQPVVKAELDKQFKEKGFKSRNKYIKHLLEKEKA